jgi:UDP-N-acetyl-D-mannosaminuronic acid transferase (WecB/TagA/CpsF family)
MSLGGSAAINQAGTDSPEGMVIGKSSTTSKVGFYGTVPIVQRTTVAFSTLAGASSTFNATSSTYGYTTKAQADAIVAQLNEAAATLVALGMHS